MVFADPSIDPEEEGEEDGFHKKNEYEDPGHHNPKGDPNRYNPNKSVLPDNAKSLWNNSRADPKNPNVRWAREGAGNKAVYHRFSQHSSGKWHWSGATNGTTNSGTPVRLVVKEYVKKIWK